jgi:hypothetical protein
MKPSEVIYLAPGGREPPKGITQHAREIIRSFEKEEFRAIDVISVIRARANDEKNLMHRSDSALRSGVRKEIARLIERGELEVVQPHINTPGQARQSGIYKEK